MYNGVGDNMRDFIDPFTYNFPSVDLHGEDRVGAITKVDELINDCIRIKSYDIIVVHGKGSGVLKNAVHEYLKRDKRVISFKTDNMNDGVTIVKLKEDL